MPKPKSSSRKSSKGSGKAGAKTASKKIVKKQSGTAAYEKKLLAMREDLVNLVQHKQEMDMTEQEVGDEADAATQSAERELMFELSDNERQTLDAIEAALRKIETGSYGQCEGCSKPIPAMRLKAIPHARYCIQCQARFETPRA
jgi:DnaK suppressor protein